MKIERSSIYAVSGIATLPSEAIPVVEDIWLELPAFGVAAAGNRPGSSLADNRRR